MLAHERHGGVRDSPGLLGVDALAPAPLHLHELDSEGLRRRMRGGKDDQVGVVKLPVGEGDQGFMLRAVVPAQATGRPKRPHPQIQHGLRLHAVVRAERVLVGVIVVAFKGTVEEVRRRELLRVADDDRLGVAME